MRPFCLPYSAQAARIIWGAGTVAVHNTLAPTQKMALCVGRPRRKNDHPRNPALPIPEDTVSAGPRVTALSALRLDKSSAIIG